MPGSEYQSHAHPGHVPASGQQPVYELETTPAAPRACHHNGFPNRDESGTLLKSPSIRARQAPIPKNTLMNWRCQNPRLKYWYWYCMAFSSDYGQLQIRVDNGAWQN